jgi:hypothetical protein
MWTESVELSVGRAQAVAALAGALSDDDELEDELELDELVEAAAVDALDSDFPLFAPARLSVR